MELDFAKDSGLIPAIVQDDSSGEVLMLGFMNREALERHARDGIRHVLQPLAQEIVDQGRKQRPEIAVARNARGLRPGCATGSRGTFRCGRVP